MNDLEQARIKAQTGLADKARCAGNLSFLTWPLLDALHFCTGCEIRVLCGQLGMSPGTLTKEDPEPRRLRSAANNAARITTVRAALAEGQTPNQIAFDEGISLRSLYRWLLIHDHEIAGRFQVSAERGKRRAA